MREVKRHIERTFYQQQQTPPWCGSLDTSSALTGKYFPRSRDHSSNRSSSSEELNLGKPDIGPFRCSSRRSSQEELSLNTSLIENFENMEDDEDNDQRVYIDWVLLDSMNYAHSIPANGRKKSQSQQEYSRMCNIEHDERVHPSSLSDRSSWSPLNRTKSFTAPTCDVTLGLLDIQHSHPSEHSRREQKMQIEIKIEENMEQSVVKNRMKGMLRNDEFFSKCYQLFTTILIAWLVLMLLARLFVKVSKVGQKSLGQTESSICNTHWPKPHPWVLQIMHRPFTLSHLQSLFLGNLELSQV